MKSELLIFCDKAFKNTTTIIRI